MDRILTYVRALSFSSSVMRYIDNSYPLYSSAFTTIQFQHAKGFSLILSNFSFLPHILQQ